MRDDFFSLLRKKTELKPDRNFDQRFWATFEREFEAAPAKRRLGARIAWVSGLATAAAAVAIYFGSPRRDAPIQGDPEVAAIMAAEPMLAELDLLSEFEELPVTDEEWEELLGGPDEA